jgi:hypothetical protein
VNSDSAQITIDYIAGIGIFLLAVFFVFQFVSGLFIPFQSGSDKSTLAADRTATLLVEQMLHADASGALNVINQSKLDSFNATDSNTLSALGLFSAQTVFDLNISVAYTNGTMMNRSGTNSLLVSGPALPDNTDIGQTKRLVLITNSSTGYNEIAMLSVRVW